MTKGLARQGFDIDLREGEAREDAFVHVFLKSRIEHKADEKCRKTGNLFIEYRQHGYPSGLATTTADYWAFEYDDNCWLLIPTTKLKGLVAQAYQDPQRRVVGGDNDNYEGVLVPIVWLVNTQERLL